MKSWELVIAGALVVAWVWMLGKPILSSLVRRFRSNSIENFRGQQAVLSEARSELYRATNETNETNQAAQTGVSELLSPAEVNNRSEFDNVDRVRPGSQKSNGSEVHVGLDVDADRVADFEVGIDAEPDVDVELDVELDPNIDGGLDPGVEILTKAGPVQSWLDQPLVSRRLQVLLGLVMANVASFFCFIAFKGMFVYLSGLMFTSLVSYVLAAARIGAREAAELDHLNENNASTMLASPFEVETERSAAETKKRSKAARRSEPTSAETWSVLFERSAGESLYDSGFFEPILELDDSLSNDELGPDNAGYAYDATAGETLDASADHGSVDDFDYLESDNGLDQGAVFKTPSRRSRSASGTRRKARPIHIDSELDEAVEPAGRSNPHLPRAAND